MAISEGRGFDYGVFHIKSEKNAQLLECISVELKIAITKAKELLDFGAVYLNQKRSFTDLLVTSKDIIRVHTSPRRFPINDVNWSTLILKETEEFIVINKPKGIPCHSTVDNFSENIIQQLQSYLNFPLFITHRLDVPTGGLLVLAKTKKFQSEFNILLADKKIKKIYKAIVRGECILQGQLIHYMENSPKAPKQVHKYFIENSLRCELIVLASQYNNQEDESELSIELITGRTHQIRAQLAAEGHPIIGDTTYAGKLWIENQIKLNCIEISFLNFNFYL